MQQQQCMSAVRCSNHKSEVINSSYVNNELAVTARKEKTINQWQKQSTMQQQQYRSEVRWQRLQERNKTECKAMFPWAVIASNSRSGGSSGFQQSSKSKESLQIEEKINGQQKSNNEQFCSSQCMSVQCIEIDWSSNKNGERVINWWQWQMTISSGGAH